MAHNHEKCDAPICPRDPSFGNNTWSWFPDEAICKAKPWTQVQKVQRRIQKLFNAGKITNTRYFTSKMLENTKRVAEGIKGRNPDLRRPRKTNSKTQTPVLTRSAKSSGTFRDLSIINL